MIYLKWLLLAACDIILLPVWYLGAPIVSLFTHEMEDKDEAMQEWGGWFGTYDNPPQGDARHQRHYGDLPAYIVRVLWLWRNPGYNFQKAIGVPYVASNTIVYKGFPHISDKYRLPGWYFARCYNEEGKLIAFEYYLVYPWMEHTCLRMRLGYKIMTDKYERYGFAPLVNTVNPLKSYGD